MTHFHVEQVPRNEDYDASRIAAFIILFMLSSRTRSFVITQWYDARARRHLPGQEDPAAAETADYQEKVVVTLKPFLCATCSVIFISSSVTAVEDQESCEGARGKNTYEYSSYRPLLSTLTERYFRFCIDLELLMSLRPLLLLLVVLQLMLEGQTVFATQLLYDFISLKIFHDDGGNGVEGQALFLKLAVIVRSYMLLPRFDLLPLVTLLWRFGVLNLLQCQSSATQQFAYDCIVHVYTNIKYSHIVV